MTTSPGQQTRTWEWDTLDESLLNEIIQWIVKVMDPEKIIMFGSRAKGTATEDSDLDLMVIVDKSEIPRPRSRPVYGALRDIFIPMDILVYTQEEVDDWQNVSVHITSTARREGKTIYEKTH
jgi:predicted nucleotidyltransferase